MLMVHGTLVHADGTWNTVVHADGTRNTVVHAEAVWDTSENGTWYTGTY